MRAKLTGIIVLSELMLIALLLFLVRLHILADAFGVVLIWLLPVAFGLHVFEEFVFPDGFADWYKAYRPRFAARITPTYLVTINLMGAIGAALIPLGAFDYRGSYSALGIRGWLYFLSILTFNAILHIRATVRMRRYSPGAITSALCYLPLSLVGFAYLLRTGAVDLLSAIICCVVGSQFQLVVNHVHERALRSGASSPEALSAAQ